MVCTKTNGLHLIFSIIHTIFGVLLAAFAIFTLTTEASVLMVFALLMGLYSTIIGVFGIACFGHRRGLKTAHLGFLSVNLLFLIGALIAVASSLDSIVDNLMELEGEKQRTSTKVMDLYDALLSMKGVIIGVTAGVTALCAATIFLGCRQRKVANEEDKKQRRAVVIGATHELP